MDSCILKATAWLQFLTDAGRSPIANTAGESPSRAFAAPIGHNGQIADERLAAEAAKTISALDAFRASRTRTDSH